MIKRATLAYLAGAIDSDGTIGVKRSTYAMRHDNGGGANYSERLALRQVTPAIPELLRETFGGALYMTKPSAKRGRPLWSWAATDVRAAEALRLLLPYLRVKREQALNALALRAVKKLSKRHRIRRGRGHVGGAQRSEEHSQQMDACYLRAKELNRVGC